MDFEFAVSLHVPTPDVNCLFINGPAEPRPFLHLHVGDEWVRNFSFEGRIMNHYFISFNLFFPLLHLFDTSKLNVRTSVGKEASRRMRSDEVHLLREVAGEWVSVPQPGLAASERGRLQVDYVTSFWSNEVCSQGRRPQEGRSTCAWCHPASQRKKSGFTAACPLKKKNEAIVWPLPCSGCAWWANKSNRLFIL